MTSFALALVLFWFAPLQQQPTPAANTSAQGTTEQAAKSPEKLIVSARTVALIGALGYVADTGLALNPSAKKAQDSLEKEVRKWGRFTVIPNPAQADMVLVLLDGNRAAGGGGVVRTSMLRVFPGGPPPKRGQLPLWEAEENGSILGTSGAGKVITKFRRYVEALDKSTPADIATNANKAAELSAATEKAQQSTTTSATSSDPESRASSVVRQSVPRRPPKYVPPFEIIGKANTYSIRGKGPAGELGTLGKIFGTGQYSSLQGAMGDVYTQMSAWGRFKFEEDVAKADLVLVVYQWDERTYSRQFHSVHSAIQVEEGGVAFERDDPALWASGTVSGGAGELISYLRFGLDQFEHGEPSTATIIRNKDFDRGTDKLKSAERKKAGQRSDLLFEAVADLRKSLRLDPSYPPAREALGKALLALNFDSAAAYEFKLALKLEPGSHDTLVNLARALGKIPDYELAGDAIREAMKVSPNQAEDHAILADLLYSKRDYAQAARAYEQAIRLDPANAEYRFRLGRALNRDNKYDLAETALRESLKLKSDDVNTMLWLGSSLTDAGKAQEAIAVLRKAAALTSDNDSVHFELGRALAAQKSYSDAIVEFNKAILIVPTSPIYHNNLAHTLADAGKADEALTEFRETVRLSPASPHAHDDLGHDLFTKAKVAEAVAEFEQAISLDSKYAIAHFNLAVAREAKGDKAGALAEYQTAHMLEPDNAEFNSKFEALTKQLQ